jgi:ABC-type glutathione transport system ATPase component
VKEIFTIIRRVNEEQGMSILLVEQNAKVALETAHYGYVLEIGRVVMNDSCDRLMHSKDIQEFYLGARKRARGASGAGKRRRLGVEFGAKSSLLQKTGKAGIQGGGRRRERAWPDRQC